MNYFLNITERKVLCNKDNRKNNGIMKLFNKDYIYSLFFNHYGFEILG